MNIVFIGCVQFSQALLECVVTLPNANVVGVVTRPSSSFHGDFQSLAEFAEAHLIPCLSTPSNDQAELSAWISACKPDVVYCFGWPFLLGKQVLSSAPLGVIGYHPTALPMNRGRHPIIWSLALGLTRTASSFFFMDEGADSGDLLSQISVEIDSSDDAETLYKKLMAVALVQVTEFTEQLASNAFPRTPQNHSFANYWRKRGRQDGLIDWRMPAEGIHNLIRALACPYPGAECKFQGLNVLIWKSTIPCAEYSEHSLANIEPGRVLRVRDNQIDVRCGVGVVRILKHEFPELPSVGDCL